ncbi:ABC transporter ATP-binding protein [Salipaludibacillus sp. HK11]|uniref:ABC transporter ATP-binding protein n=1 Tax=Salipaludibacillus sp. HK11 TaxID=3394320 RepID=UPI0039FC9C3F
MNIVITAIEKSFGKLKALHPFDFTIHAGEFVSLLGPSGCGKTTLLRMIAGLEEPDQGEISFGDQVVFSKKDHVNKAPQKRNIGMVFQDFALWPHMTVFENVAYSLKATGKKRGLKEKVIEALENVQLSDHAERYPHQLSGGQQQRVAIARAIASDPSIILLDEPLSALDASLRDEMRILLQHLVKKLNMTALYVTHDQNEAMAMSDRVVVLHAGEKMQAATPEEVYAEPINDTVASFVGKGRLLNGQFKTYRNVSYLKMNHLVQLPIPQLTESILENEWITVIIRPEQIKLSTNEIETGLKGFIETVSFLGERYEVTFKIDGSDESLFAYSPNRLEIGKEIYFEINTRSIHIIQTQHQQGSTKPTFSQKQGGIKHETA